MGIQINGNTNNINAGIGSLSIEDINELDIVGVATAANFKTGVSNLHDVGLTLSGGQIDVGSNIKIGTAGVVTATSFVGSGANLTGINADLVNDTSPQLGADLDTNGFGILVDDNKVVNFGNNNDLMIYHSGTHSYIKNKTNNLYIMSTNTEYGIEVHGDGKVRLNYDNSPKIETTNTGATVTGNLVFGANAKAQLFENGNQQGVQSTHSGSSAHLMSHDGNEDIHVDPSGYIKFEVAGSERVRIDSSGRVLIGLTSASRTTSMIISGNSTTGATGQAVLNMDIGTTSISDGTSIGVFRFGATGDRRGADIRAEGAGTWSAGSSHPTNLIFGTNKANTSGTPTERMRIRSDGHVQLQHGLTGLSGGGVIVCAAKSSTGTANQSNYKVDFVVPMGDLGVKQEHEDIRAQFGSGQTATDWSHALGGSGILIATVQNNYYWGFRTKIYHITTYGNSSNNVTQLNVLHNYSAAGHGGNSAAVDLAVQSHDGKTPKLRATFSGDYWNSNVLTVTYIGSAVASTGNIRQLTTFDSKLTGQDPTWK